MFRNPRENSLRDLENALLPSVGRSTTPPAEEDPEPKSSPYFTLAKTPSGAKQCQNSDHETTPTPMARKASVTKPAPFKPGSARPKRGPQNQSILSFFGKASKEIVPENGVEDGDPLFFKETSRGAVDGGARKAITTEALLAHVPNLYEFDPEELYHDIGSPVKRRKVMNVDDDVNLVIRTPSPQSRSRSRDNKYPSVTEKKEISREAAKPRSERRRGGFVEESSSDEEEVKPVESEEAVAEDGRPNVDQKKFQRALQDYPDSIWDKKVPEDNNINSGRTIRPSRAEQSKAKKRLFGAELEGSEDEVLLPPFSRETNGIFTPDEFDAIGDFEDEEFLEGEEMMERRWMEEQRELEMGLDEDSKSEGEDEELMTPQESLIESPGLSECTTEASCPVCNVGLSGTTEIQATEHVNACLDGNPTPLPPQHTPLESKTAQQSVNVIAPAKRFQRAAIARPAQQNPFAPARDGRGSGSAFSRLMSGHAEDAAWTEAAANEAQSRGKPAYERTCPFYKIMPGLFICVDAFRYGKVEGQNAYFLSHFHSDHYIGLTSSWTHGPIYCSKVTANLVRQQLRVDPQYVVALEFEKKVEVPNTKGVFVTMLPANHCPGSSLFLFEKVVSRDKYREPRFNRILHCGDFRACPAHVNHPLLKPDVVDAISGQAKQQVIDTCYLDTTYLTPKYSFPSQGDVIDACAQMCVSLSKEVVDSSDAWEKTKLERASRTMNKFLEKGPSETGLINTDEDEDIKPTTRGRLLVVIGTYSIGKERICLGIAKALNSRIYAPPGKMRICACLEDPELNARLTSNPLEAQVHMQTLMEIRAETLAEYLHTYRGHFARVVGFRPTGWNYRPPASRFTENPAVSTVLHSEGWKSRFGMKDLVPQRGSTRESNCFGVPYSEHSSFRELTMFCCALRIGRVVPTVNVGSRKGRERMKGWIEKWELERRKNGLFKVEVGEEGWGSGDGGLRYGV